MPSAQKKSTLRHKSRYSKRARFWLSLLSSLAQVVALVVVAAVVLPALGFHLAWWVVSLLALAIAGWDVFTYVMGTRALDKEVVRDIESMAGLKGVAAEHLGPTGVVQVRGELWQARSVDGVIEKGAKIEVVDQEGLTLRVRKLSAPR